METSERSTPTLSVVVATIVGAPFLDDCLGSIQDQAAALNAEVIVVACGDDAFAGRIKVNFPWVNVIHRPDRETVPELRRVGAQQAKGDIVAIIEEHCLADPNWLQRAVLAHSQGDYAAVGGPVVDHNYSRLQDWVVYFCEYNGYLPPWGQGEVSELNGANIAYKRQVLLDHMNLLGDGYWEASLHPVLLAEGCKFLSAPQMVVYHRGPFPFGYYLRQRYWFSRAFAGARSKAMPGSRRLAYLAAAPVVPFVLLARMTRRIWNKHCHVEKFALSLPLLIPALTVYAAGEWVGYLAGPGDALSKVE